MITRDNYTGADAAQKLKNNFVVEGIKTVNSAAVEVFDNYNVNWKTNTANTTLSNSSDWEYVAQPILTGKTAVQDQTIKYWDYSATQYDFWAYSLGGGTATVSSLAHDATLTSSAYTFEGTAAQLKDVFVSDLVTAYNPTVSGQPAFNQVVQFKFRSLVAKVRIALYETVPGYSIKEVKFYNSGTATSSSTTAALYTTGDDVFNNNGVCTVYFKTIGSGNVNDLDYNKAHIGFTAASGEGGTAKSMNFGEFDAAAATTTYVIREKYETASTTDKLYIGRASNEASYPGAKADNYYQIVLPNENGSVLNLKVDYTLISTDGSGETIKVTGASAQVPSIYAQWKSGYAYTYLFKISKDTNGQTGGTTGPAGLYPITFDAVVTETEEGVQETITTVATPSITTYTQGRVVTENDEYLTGNNIYVVVGDGTELTASNAKLYTVTLDDGADQTINEASVHNALANGTYDATGKTYTVTDYDGKSLVVTESDLLSMEDGIPAEDAPDGNAITVSCAKFTPTATGNYVFQYIEENSTYTAETAPTYNATLPGAITTTGTGYSFTSYGDNTGTTQYGSGKVKVVSTANGWTTVLVISNTVDGFVGKQYKVHAETLDPDEYYQLYSTDGMAQPIYVKVSDKTNSIAQADVDAYNATLPGAVKAGDMIPDKYHYKVIKVQ